MQDFADKIEEEKGITQKAGITKAPNEKKAIAYMDAFTNVDFISEDEKELIQLAKEAIREGRFQTLHRDINKLERSTKRKSIKPVFILEKLMEILAQYKLEKKYEMVKYQNQLQLDFNELNPEIIISESFKNG